MVSYSEQSKDDLRDILWGLAMWEKHPLGYEHAMSYVGDIRYVCDHLDKQTYHRDTVNNTHKRYGSKVYPYKRNKQTTWYIIYNLDIHGNVYVNKIMSNYLTV
jgi:hypothetical protein